MIELSRLRTISCDRGTRVNASGAKFVKDRINDYCSHVPTENCFEST
jgi:hypothetical protein